MRLFSLSFLVSLTVASSPSFRILSSNEDLKTLSSSLPSQSWTWLSLFGMEGDGSMKWRGKNSRVNSFVIVDYGEDENAYMPSSLQYLESIPFSNEAIESLRELNSVTGDIVAKEVKWIGVGSEKLTPDSNLIQEKLLTGLSFSDESLVQALEEMYMMAAIVDEETPTYSQPILGFQLRGLKNVRERYGQDSEEYSMLSTAMKALLDAVYTHLAPSNVVHIHLPSSHLRNNADMRGLLTFLQPSTSLRSKRAPDSETTQVILSGQTCWAEYQDCMTETNDCSGRGDCITGLKNSLTGPEECYVCSCGKTTTGEGNQVKTTYWTGEFCEKQDISQEFFLLFFTSVFLIALVGVSVVLISSVGNKELPNQLASIAGGHLKKD